jgi:hypothetical protein
MRTKVATRYQILCWAEVVTYITGTALCKIAFRKLRMLIRMAQKVKIIKPWIKVGESKSEYKIETYP